MSITKEDLRARLIEDRDNLREEIARMGDEDARGMGESDTQHYGNHPGDVSDETFELTKNMALTEHLRRQLEMTEEALRRYDEGSYGVCANCGEEIPLERLEALPHATLCIRCKQELETGS